MSDNSDAIEKIEKQIEQLQNPDNNAGNRVIYIDSLVDDHIQRNMKKMESDTKEFHTIKLNDTSNSLDDTKKIDILSDELFQNLEEKENKDKLNKNEFPYLYLFIGFILLFLILIFLFL